MYKDKELHSYLTTTFRAEHKLWASELSAIGVSQGQPKMLSYIMKNDGCIQKEIAQGAGIEASSATSILGVMERDGLIERKQGAEDKRCYHVFITEKGTKSSQRIKEIGTRISAIGLTDFSDEEMRTLRMLLEKAQHNYEAYAVK